MRCGASFSEPENATEPDDAFGVFGATFRELGWKTPIFSGRESGPENSKRIPGKVRNPRISAARVAKLDTLGFAWEMSAAAISQQISKARQPRAGLSFGAGIHLNVLNTSYARMLL